MSIEQVIEANWATLYGQVRHRWYSPTDADMLNIDGDYDALLKTLRMRDDSSDATAERDIQELLDEVAPSNSR